MTTTARSTVSSCKWQRWEGKEQRQGRQIVGRCVCKMTEKEENGNTTKQERVNTMFQRIILRHVLWLIYFATPTFLKSVALFYVL
jgi:hypothetical protein